MYIYKATSKTTGKAYIGISVNFTRRQKVHYKLSIEGTSTTRFHNALRKYGWEDFVWEFLEQCENREMLCEREVYWISFYDTFKNGYNLTVGGDGNICPSEETLKKQSISRKGRKFSDEWKKAISDGNKGKKKSEEHINSLKIARNKRPLYSEETKQKMSKSSKGKINIKIYTLIDPEGEEHITLEGLTKFCEDHNLHRTNMHLLTKGKFKQYRKWTLKKEEENG